MQHRIYSRNLVELYERREKKQRRSDVDRWWIKATVPERCMKQRKPVNSLKLDRIKLFIKAITHFLKKEHSLIKLRYKYICHYPFARWSSKVVLESLECKNKMIHIHSSVMLTTSPAVARDWNKKLSEGNLGIEFITWWRLWLPVRTRLCGTVDPACSDGERWWKALAFFGRLLHADEKEDGNEESGNGWYHVRSPPTIAQNIWPEKKTGMVSKSKFKRFSASLGKRGKWCLIWSRGGMHLNTCWCEVNANDVSQAVAEIDSPWEDSVGQSAGIWGKNVGDQAAGNWTAHGLTCSKKTTIRSGH